MRQPSRSLLQHWRQWMKTSVWEIDIDPSAGIAMTALIDQTWPREIYFGPSCVIDEEVMVLTRDITRPLVSRDVPDGASVLGNPGRIVAAVPAAAR